MITNKYRTETELKTSPISGGRLIHTYRHTIEARATYEHRLEVGENYYSLAAFIFGMDEYWWVLLDLNSVRDAFSLRVGEIIKLPTNLVNNAHKRIF